MWLKLLKFFPLLFLASGEGGGGNDGGADGGGDGKGGDDGKGGGADGGNKGTIFDVQDDDKGKGSDNVLATPLTMEALAQGDLKWTGTNKDIKAFLDAEIGKAVGGKLKAPDTLPQKYKNQDGTVNVDAITKAAADFEKKWGGLEKPVTDAAAFKFEVTSPKLKELGIEKINETDPVVQGFRGIGAQFKLTQEQASGILQWALEQGAELGEGIDPVVIAKQEFAKLGESAPAIKNGLNDWFKSMIGSGVFSEGDLEELQIMAGTAAASKIMLKLRELTGEPPLTLPKGEIDSETPSKEDLAAMVNDPKYGVDQTFTQKVDRLYEKTYGTDNTGTSERGLGVSAAHARARQSQQKKA